LTTADSVRRLTLSQAQRGYSVQLQGIVTYCDPEWPILYINDASGGILVEPARLDSSLKFGQKVEVFGVSAQGSILPIVAKARVQTLGSIGTLPIRKISLDKIDIQRDDSQWMQIEGIVHNAYQESQYSILEVYDRKKKIQIRIRELFNKMPANELIDARVRIQGVLAVITDSAQKAIGFELRVPREVDISILDPSKKSPNQLPITNIASLQKIWQSQPPQRRLRIQGTVMPGNARGTLLVKDKTGIIEAQTLFTRPIAPGDEVDLSGFADLSSDRPRIISAIYLRIKALAIQSREETGLPTLTRIGQVRILAGEEAARGFPVRIKGVITYHNPQLSMTFIQDGHDAIYLQSLDPALALEEGKKYEVEGFSAPGDFAPIIVKPTFRLLGNAPQPSALDLTLDQLSTGQYDCLRVRIQGIVRSVQQIGNRWCLRLFNEGKGLEVWLPNQTPSTQLFSWQDAKISAEGICSIQVGERGNITGFRLNVSAASGIRILEPARADPFSAPLRPIRNVFRLANRQEAGHRVRIQGVLLHQQPGRALYLRDATGCITVLIDHFLPVNPSDLITASGYVIPGDFAPAMGDALVKRLSSSRLPEPKVLPDGHSLNNNFHGDLVVIRAKLMDQWRSWDGRGYLLQGLGNTGAMFEAVLENAPDNADAIKIRTGSELELTGIYQLRARPGQPYRFSLLLRTPKDILVLKSAPWWTLKHTYWAFGILCFLILSALSWIAMLRRRVNRQTETIRQQIEAEATLEKKYRELFERSNDIVFACDRAGKLISINPAGTRILGYDNQALMHLNPEQLVDPVSLPNVQKWIKQKLNAVEGLHLECNLLAQDGRTIPVEVNAEIVFTDGKPAGAQGIARDITERKQAEETLRESEEKLREGQKLEAIGKLAGGIAHDFNNILSAILGYAELSLEEVPADHAIRDYLDQIIKAGKRARDVVQQILAFSRKLDHERHPIYLQSTVEEILKLLKATLPSTIEIRTHINPACGPVMADTTQMHQVILNLATNASHAMQEKGGVLSIELDPIELKDHLTQELEPGNYTRLTIRDTGPGIEAEVQKRIFEPYFTTKSAGQGSGLGLAVVHGIIQSHGGAIMVESAPGQGATFQVYLPRCKENPAAASAPLTEIVEGKGNILLVDDEAAIVNLGSRALERLGYKVTGETRSTRALEMFLANPEYFDLVITDQTMPNLTGISLSQELWQIRPELPVIISSGFSEQITPDKVTGLGFRCLLPKPYTIAELARVVQQSLSH
jgi:PAS domain S-box-containing protein